MIKRRFKITKEDVRTHGMTPGCRGCIALNRVGQAVNHSDTCRERVNKELEAEGDERVTRAKDRREDEQTEALMAEEERLFGEEADKDEEIDENYGEEDKDDEEVMGAVCRNTKKQEAKIRTTGRMESTKR